MSRPLLGTIQRSSLQRKRRGLRSIRPIGLFRTQLVENCLDRRVRFQQGRPQHFPKLSPRLFQFLPRSLHRWIAHGLLMSCPEPGAFVFGQIRQESRPAFVLELTERPVRSIRRLLGEDDGPELGDASQGRNEEVSQFRIHLFVF